MFSIINLQNALVNTSLNPLDYYVKIALTAIRSQVTSCFCFGKNVLNHFDRELDYFEVLELRPIAVHVVV